MEFTSIHKNLSKELSYYQHYFSDKRLKRSFFEIFKALIFTGKITISNLARFMADKNPHYVAKRYYRFLSRDDLPIKKIWKHFLELESYKVHEDAEIIYDLSDISKDHRDKLDHLFSYEKICKVHDGSENAIKFGYPIRCAGVVHKEQFSPLLFRISSYEDESFVSENEWILNDIDDIMSACNKRGKLILDRGFDRSVILNHLISKKYKFILRMQKLRHYRWGDKDRSFSVEEIQRHIVPYKNNKPISGLYYTQVFLTNSTDPLSFIIVIPKRKTKKTNRMKEPLYLLTNKGVKSKNGASKILHSYLKRWKIENYFQMLKSKFEIENIRVRKIKSIEMLLTIIMIATSIAHDLYIKLNKKDIKKIERLNQSFSYKEKSYILLNLFRQIGIILMAKRKENLFHNYKYNVVFNKLFQQGTYG